MDTTKDLINKYLTGKCTHQEAAQVERFLKNNPQAMDELFPLSEWESITSFPDLTSKDSLYDLVNHRIHRRQRFIRIVKRVGQIAACLVLFMGIYYGFNYFEGRSLAADTPKLVQQAPKAPVAVSNLYYINSDTKPMRIHVSDGSTITLYPKSEVRFAESFVDTDERIIELKGKAQFEVAKDKAKPFRVLSQGLVTSALGTVFIVDELAAHETKVNLVEGSIEVQTLDPSHKTIKRIIKPQESLRIDHQTATILTEVKMSDRQSDREGYYTQNKQKIIIKNLAVIDILQNLEQNFNIQLQYDQVVLRNKYFSGTFPNAPLAYKKIIEEINYLHKSTIQKI